MSAGIRVLLVEDHPVVLRGLHAICSEQPGIEIVGETTTASAALTAAEALQPDVVVLPVRLGGTRSGVELCRSIKAACAAKMVVFTSYTRTVDLQVAMLAGADALVVKTASSEEFLDALRQVVAGSEPLVLGPGAGLSASARQFSPAEPLTEREDQILHLVVEGLTNPEVAARLTIEVSTVKTHMRSILRKLGMETRRELFEEPR